jgi:anaerobic magnesium-protoporphyrin IX monomethyl ester cyclase
MIKCILIVGIVPTTRSVNDWFYLDLVVVDMDVLLLNPYDENAVKNGLGLITPPLSLMYLASALEEDSFSVKIHDDDLHLQGYYRFADLASRGDPHLIGVTATTSTIGTALNYLQVIKERLPDVITVIGGPHPTFMPRETLESRVVDVVVLGEGEETLRELASNPDLSSVRGIAYQDSEGRLKLNQPRPLIKDLDSLPFPARHLVPFDSYGDSSGIITSRGCVYSCGYCSSSQIMGKKFRARSPQNVVDEMEELVDQYGVRDMAFMDDTFMLNKKRAGDIAREIKSRDLDVSFVASSRVDSVNQDLLFKLKEAGMNTLYYGVESGSQRVLDLMKKGITLKQAESAVKSAKEAGLKVLTSFILGYPGETREDLDKTIDFSIKLDPDYSQYSILTPFPGTPLYQDLKEKGLIDTEDWKEYTVMKPVLKYEKLGLSKEMVERKLTRAYLRFYARPRYLLRHRHMLKVMVETVLRSFVLPKLRGSSVEGWYRSLDEG